MTPNLYKPSLLWSLLFCTATTPSLTIAAPDLRGLVSGSATVTTGPVTTVDQTSQNVVIDWNSFNINGGETVNFNQPDVNSIALNRDFQGSPSQIFGDINANGNVFLLNPAGVLIGNGASIDVGGLFLSDMSISDQDAIDFDSFDITAVGGQLPFTDQDLAAGGITIAGQITTQGSNGLTVLGQYIYIDDGANTLSQNAETTMNIAGSAVLVTDPSGMYGVQLEDALTNDISPNQILYDVTTAPGASVDVQTTNADMNFNIKYSSQLDVSPIGNIIGHQIIGPNRFRFNVLAVAPPDTVTDEEQDIIDDTISDTLFDEPEDENSLLLGDASNQNENNLDNLIADCQVTTENRKDCLKQKALKRFLGKLLIGGSLPD